MKLRFNKNVEVDGKQFYKNDTAWLKAIQRYTEQNNGDYMYLIESAGILYSVNKKFLDLE